MYQPRNTQQQVERDASDAASGTEWRKSGEHPHMFWLSGFNWNRNLSHHVIHRWYNRLTWHRIKSSEDQGMMLRRIYRWPFLLRKQARRSTRTYGQRVTELTGKSPARQRLEQVYLGLLFSIPPKSYYLFRLFEPERRRNASKYIHRFETKVSLFQILNHNLGDPSGSEILGDKVAFAERCRERALTTPTLYLALRKGEVIHHDWKREGLPASDLIVKQRVGRGGHLMTRWEYLGQDLYVDNNGNQLDSNKLLQQLKVESREVNMIVVARIVNHPEILAFAGPGGKILTTCRLVTAFNEMGEAEVLTATFKIAVKQTVADNVHFGGLASPVNIQTGALGPGISTAPLGEHVDVHPVSGMRITGTKLPLWKETVDLVRRAHAEFPESIFIGWDVGISEAGPVLVEGNTGLCVHLQQTPQGEPLGSARFGELMAYHLNRIDPRTASYFTSAYRPDN
jgi:hypothetical protein